ncbi:DUF726 domain-containing protein [Halomonas desiderata]|uniref:DUF726 domain-containing protein n=1 Tax=Billgrantia desiderata TaxID=52021 RepID=UPI00174A89DA|nr:DUF726 domain-containing protein [Halomonas desiderata]
MSIGTQKFLYFLVKLAETCFEPKGGLASFIGSKQYSIFIEERISPHVNLSDKSKEASASAAVGFCSASCILYDTIYEGSLGKKELEEIAPSEKIFLLNMMKVNELGDKEAGDFLEIFNRLISRKCASHSGAESQFLSYVLGAFSERAGKVPDEVGQPTLETFIAVEQPWLKNLALLASLSGFEREEKPWQDSDIKELSHAFGVDAKTIEKRLFTAVKIYKTACIVALESLHDDCKDDYSVHDPVTVYMSKALFAADIATDFVPGVSVVKRLYKNSQKAMRVIDDATLDDSRSMDKISGLRAMNDNGGANIIHICIDGFMSESTKGQFSDWTEALQVLGVDGRIMGFSWPSSNYLSVGAASWYESVKKAAYFGANLAEQIKLLKMANSNLEINLYGHSLGSRIIHHTLLSLMESKCKVSQVFLFGGAVSRVDKHKWSRALQSVENKVFNFYSSNDDVLCRLYRMAQFGDEPIGLGNIEFFASKGYISCAVQNLDVSSVVSGHTEYKPNLVRLLGAIKAEPV